MPRVFYLSRVIVKPAEQVDAISFDTLRRLLCCARSDTPGGGAVRYC